MLDVSPVSRAEIDTTDPDAAHQWLTDVYAEHTPELSGDRTGFRMRVTSLEADRFRIDDIRHTMSVRADLAPFDKLVVTRVRDGHYRMDAGGRSVSRLPGDLAVMDPRAPGRTSWDLLDVETVALDLDAARRIAGELSGVRPERVVFALAGPIDEARARYWTTTVEHLRQHVLGHDELTAAPLLRSQVLRQLVSAAVVTFPNSALDVVDGPAAASPGGAEPATVRRAVAFMDTHAHDDIGITQIAEAARIGSRGLQAAFRRHRGQTPLEYLRRVRMEGAHRDLQAADPARADTVAVVAARWGFTHPGRFSVEYRRTYGHSPSATLRA